MSTPEFTTTLVHADRHFGVEHGALHKPIHVSTQYGYDRVEDLIGMFQGSLKGAYGYSRQGTPTSNALESKLASLDEGIGAIAFATGMAAITAIFTTLLKAGDHVISSQFVFGNTNSLLETLSGLGVEVDSVDVTDVRHVAAALRPQTRMVFVETVANPVTQIPDLEAIGQLCRQHGVLLVVDNTILSPGLFKPKQIGAGLVVHSLSKSMAGHGQALGGVVIDTGLYDWQPYPNIAPAYRQGDSRLWGLTQLRKKGLRDMGATLSAQHAHAISIGLESLALRLDHSSASALALAQMLEAHPAVARVYYPGLASHPQHAIARKLFRASSWLLSFELRNADDCLPFLNRLQLAIKSTGLGDARSLIIPVAPTIFWEAGAAARARMGIGDGLIRLSVGLEASADLLADFKQALAQTGER
jgi:O-acetylhomoserine (thiol)-lyase